MSDKELPREKKQTICFSFHFACVHSIFILKFSYRDCGIIFERNSQIHSLKQINLTLTLRFRHLF